MLMVVWFGGDRAGSGRDAREGSIGRKASGIDACAMLSRSRHGCVMVQLGSVDPIFSVRARSLGDAVVELPLEPVVERLRCSARSTVAELSWCMLCRGRDA